METNYALTAISAMAVAWLLWRFARGRQRPAGTDGREAEASITWLGTYTTAFQRCLDILDLMELELVDADPNHGAIAGRGRLAGIGAGTTLRIGLRTQEGITTVSLLADSRMVETGQSRRLLRRFVDIWDRMPDPMPAEPPG